MNAPNQPSLSPLLAGLLLVAGGAFWTGILLAAGGGNTFFRIVVGTIVALSLASVAPLFTRAWRDAGELLAWALLGVEAALALLTIFSLAIFGWIPVVLTILAIDWWPRRPRERVITGPHLLVQLVAFLAVLAPLIVPA